MDNQPNNHPQNPAIIRPGEENRPRLRKIKRPKQHNGPISGNPSANRDNNPNFPNRPNLNQPAQSPSALVRAETRDMYTQNYNNYNEPSQNYIDEDPFPEDTFVYQGEQNFSAHTIDNKKMLIISCICIVIGLVFGMFMSSGEKVVHDGLRGIVANPEVPKGRARCGVAEKTQGCVLYIMNPQRQDLNGRDFYDLAAQLTGRQRFVIETGNMRYSTIKIKPGNIAQLNIPPLQ